mgnify:CR=1 FL=1
MNTYLIPWKKYMDFSGRAPRKEFWTFYLVNAAVVILVGAFYGDGLMRHPMGISVYSPSVDTFLFAFLVVAFFPTLAVIVRRLHDTGRRGWWVLLGFVPVVGGLILLILLLFESQAGANRYGPAPNH